jgi:hypothetical protein
MSPRTGPGDPLLIARTRRRQSETNVCHRLKTTIKRANEGLVELDIEPVSQHVSRTRCGALTRACGPRCGTIRSTSPSSSVTPTDLHVPRLSEGG